MNCEVGKLLWEHHNHADPKQVRVHKVGSFCGKAVRPLILGTKCCAGGLQGRLVEGSAMPEARISESPELSSTRGILVEHASVTIGVIVKQVKVNAQQIHRGFSGIVSGANTRNLIHLRIPEGFMSACSTSNFKRLVRNPLKEDLEAQVCGVTKAGTRASGVP